ncbi:threonine/serine exporter family protein [Pseudolactococcus insecticola]|uniref:Membrane protein n=1 Tax=Pseudolactococcus insecticola TaxID=2709158 RepID=A0A6A0B621_9LACT|nr:threonine/serine exporter family protein [Lactococcus insecticola]GFH39958.1 membrane protein [Lactococcus insecticola]
MIILRHLVIQTLLAYVGSFAFGIILNIPRRTLHRAGIVGGASWLVYELVDLGTQHIMARNWRIVLGSFLGAVVIGVVSLTMSRAQKVPMLIYNIPGIFPLVPGGQAYQVVRNLVVGNQAIARQNFELVVIIVAALATGFWLAELINRLRGMIRLA